MDMRIANAYNAYSVQNLKNVPAAKKADRAGKAEAQKDTYSLSERAEDYQTVKKALAGIPDIRSDKVNQIKAKIENNTYQVSADEIAAKILRGLDE